MQDSSYSKTACQAVASGTGRGLVRGGGVNHMAKNVREAPTGHWRIIQWVNITLIFATLACALALGVLVWIEQPTTKVVPYLGPTTYSYLLSGNNSSLLLSVNTKCPAPEGVYMVGVASGQPAINCTAGTRIVWDRPPSGLLLFLNGALIPLGMALTGFVTFSLALKWKESQDKEEEDPITLGMLML